MKYSTKKEITEKLFLSIQIKKRFNERNVYPIGHMAKKLYNGFNVTQQEETKETTIKRLLNFNKKPNNISETNISNIIYSFSKGKTKALELFVEEYHQEFSGFELSESYFTFFKKWDNSPFKIDEDAYNFPINEVSAYLQLDKKNSPEVIHETYNSEGVIFDVSIHTDVKDIGKVVINLFENNIGIKIMKSSPVKRNVRNLLNPHFSHTWTLANHLKGIPSLLNLIKETIELSVLSEKWLWKKSIKADQIILMEIHSGTTIIIKNLRK